MIFKCILKNNVIKLAKKTKSTIDQLDKNVKSDLPQRSKFARKKNRGSLNNVCSSVSRSASERNN